MTIKAMLHQAKQQLAAGLPANEAALEAQLLLRHVLGDVSRAWLISHEAQALTIAQQAKFNGFLERRLRGEPVAYLLGVREFYGLDLAVTPDVLIPRADTETLVETALSRIPSDQPCRVLDLGTGSGAIAIAIATHRPHATVTAVDRSEAAIAVAHGNAERLSVRNLRLRCSNWFSALQGEVFEIIIGNPPYIAAHDPHLHQGDLRFEPAEALASGPDGLDDIRTIAAQAPAHLAAGGWLMLEHGYDQAERVAELFREQAFVETSHTADLAGILRVTLGKKP